MDPRERRAVLVRALIAGAAGGLVLATSDFLAGWLWLPDVGARALYGARLSGLLVPLGALAALSVVGIDRAARSLVRRAPRPRHVAPLPLLAFLSPALVALAIATLSGRRASRVPLHDLVVALAALALISGTYLGLRAARRIARERRTRFGRRASIALTAIAFALVASKADQSLYPRHYEALHAALSAIGWASASLGAWLLVPSRWTSIPRRALAPLLSAALALTLLSLPSDHDGRAALLSPRASSARSVMLALSPAIFSLTRSRASAAAVDRARRAREARQRALSSGHLPRWDGAHVVIVTIDALRADHLGLYGYARPISPAFDRLADEGVVFDRAWTTTPRSSYSLCSLMTGVALHAQLRAGEPLPDETLAARVAERGYHTAAFYPDGIFFHQGERLAIYRERELSFLRRDAENHDAESLTDAVLAELEDLRARGEPPALLWAHYFDVHEPYEERALGDSPVDRYDGEIRDVDRAFARLREGLAALSREVVLVVTADHGEEHRDHGGLFHGGSLYEEQLRVPLVVVAPGLTPRRVREPVSLADVAPTLLAMIGAEPLGEGVDLRPALVGRALDRGPIRATEDGLAAVLRWPHKLIVDERAGTLELFDLARDPRERESEADERPELVGALQAELAAF